MGAAGAGPAFADLREEIVALVVHQNEGGEVLHLNLPDGFHAQFRVFQQFHLPDVILGQDGGGTADGTQVKAAVLLAGVRHLLAAVALGDLSLIHISEPTRLGMISYAVFCLKKKKNHVQSILALL